MSRAMPRPRAPKITEAAPQTCEMLEEIREICRMIHQEMAVAHGNRDLQDDTVFGALLCAFFQPVCRSLRTIDQLSAVPGVRELLEEDRIARSTLSDALKRFDVKVLAGVVRIVKRRLPQLKHQDAVLERLTQLVVAADGSSFRMAGEVAWALQRRRDRQGKKDSQVKLHLQVDVRRWTMRNMAVTGSSQVPGGASEQAVLGRMLEAGVIYLIDRGYFGFDLLKQIPQAGGHFVLRLKKDIEFRPQQECSLKEADHQAGIGTDQLGLVGKSDEQISQQNPRNDKRLKTPPQQLMRLVSVWDPSKREWVRLLTDLLDVEAWVIGELYRHRWIVELFLRWLKITAGFAHLLSHSPAGVQVQMYVALIGTLLIHLHTGMPVSKYSLLALGMVASGQASYRDMLPGLLRLERERILEKQRLARKKAEKSGK